MEEQDPSPLYLKGFNHGYTIRKSEPELGQLILEKTDAPEEYLSGFKDGGKQYEIEQGRDMDGPAKSDPGMDIER